MAADGVINCVEGAHAHGLLALHATLAHRRWRDGVARQGVNKFVIVDLPVAIVVDIFNEALDARLVDGNIPKVEGTEDLLGVHRARVVDVDVLKGLANVLEARGDRIHGLRLQRLRIDTLGGTIKIVD